LMTATDYMPCGYCDDTGRCAAQLPGDDAPDATADCTCRANSRGCDGCSHPTCAGCGGKYADKPGAA